MVDHSQCFVCSERKSVTTPGVRFFQISENEVEGWYTVSHDFQSYSGILHGGMVATLLDTAMNQCLLLRDIHAFTAELVIRFLNPVQVGSTVRIIGKFIKQRHNVFFMQGSISSGKTNFAQATASFIDACRLTRNPCVFQRQLPSDGASNLRSS